MSHTISIIRESLCEFIKTNLVADGVEVLPETPLEELGLDSFSIIEIILFIERKFALSLPDEALTKQNTRSVEALAECILHYHTKS